MQAVLYRDDRLRLATLPEGRNRVYLDSLDFNLDQLWKHKLHIKNEGTAPIPLIQSRVLYTDQSSNWVKKGVNVGDWEVKNVAVLFNPQAFTYPFDQQQVTIDISSFSYNERDIEIN